MQMPATQPPSQPNQPQKWESLGEPAEPKPAAKVSPSDDLLQLNTVFSAPLQQSSSAAAFSQSPSFPPSQAFPAAEGFGQAPPQAGPWGGPTATTGKPVSRKSIESQSLDNRELKQRRF